MVDHELALERGGPRYLEAGAELRPGRPALFGVPYDGTTSFRPGTRFGPDALRVASVGLETYSPALDRDLEEHPFCDLGDLEIPRGATAPVLALAERAARVVSDAGAVPLMLGGEHSVTVGPVRALAALHADLCVLQLDAHADLRDGYLGDPFSHASAMRRCLDVLAGPDAMIQAGIRSGTREEFAELRGSGRWVDAEAAAIAAALKRWGERPIYVTIDLDVFDPAYMPGTGTPEPGGIDWSAFARIVDVIPWGRVVGADVVELSPGLDASGRSSVLAAKVVRELLLMMGS